MRGQGRWRWREKLREKEQRQGGWNVWRRKGDDRRGIGQPSGGDITHYFFSNFSENYAEKDLWEVFQRYDRVWEVFIAQKRDKHGKRVGFVRFIGVKNPMKLERELDTIIFGSTKMHVNFPRFEKRQVAVETRREDPMRGQPVITPETIREPGRAQDVNATGGTKYPTGMTFAQDEPLIERWNGPTVHEGPDWLKRSVVGVIKNLDLIPSLQNAAMLEGFNYIQVCYMGDDLLLLTGSEGFNLEEALKGTEEGPDAVFDVLYPWSPRDAPDFRVTWVRCTGLPLHMWSTECFAEAVRPVGDLLSIDAKNASFNTLEFARLLIRTNEPLWISHFRRVNVNGVVYSLRMMEELGVTTP